MVLFLVFQHNQKTLKRVLSLVLATFTGIATTAYADGSFPCNGDISLQWYYDGQKIFDTAVDPNSDASIETTGAHQQ